MLVFPNDRSFRRLADRGNPGVIQDLEVMPSHRGIGAGRALMDRAHADAAERGFRWLWLSTGSDEGSAAARSLYRSLGYIEEPDSLYIESELILTDDGSPKVYLEIVTSWVKDL